MQSHALEAISADAWGLMGLALGLLEHAHSSLLTPSLLPAMAMFVVDSRKALRVLDPALAATLEDEFLSQLALSRRRAKLLDDRVLSVDEAARELMAIASNQTQHFLGLHSGPLAPLKRALQPDIGLTTYDGRLVATTHFTAAIVGWRDGTDPEALGTQIAVAASEFATYGLSLLLSFDLGVPDPLPVDMLDRPVVMRDAYSPSLYRRGLMNGLPHELAVGAAGVLVTVNHLRHIALPVLPPRSLTAFRLKTITAFHADSYLTYLQNRLYCDGSDSPLRNALSGVLGQPASRWLRKRKALRNTLVHYLADADDSHSKCSRSAVLAKLGGKPVEEMDELVDSHLETMARMLEQAFELAGSVTIGSVVR
ncbi:MAG: hypothetical protein LLG24_07935 [Actinomycetia bacterium]|nr:hypothetical protein [Actinomycetes bacterium]